MADVRPAFARDGYLLLRGALDAAALRPFAALADAHYALLTEDARAARRSTGSLISLWSDVAFAPLLTLEETRAALSSLGHTAPLLSNGYVVSKPPRAPRTFWHEDWWGWSDAQSYGPFVHQIAALFYLVDTAPQNGCLRVIPGSHRKRHPLHRDTSEERIAMLRRAADPSTPEMVDAAGEIDVAMAVGDLALLDARLLHATHANDSDAARPAVLVWYVPDYHGWSPELRARLPNVVAPAAWPAGVRARIDPLLPPCSGVDTPAPSPFGLSPDARLT